MKGTTRTLFVVSLLAFLALGFVTPALAQDQLNLADGRVNSFFFGGGSNNITLTMPTGNCSGGTCILAQAAGTGTGHLAGSGTYTISAPATTPVAGGYAGPFSLTVEANGNSIVHQTAQIQFNYTSTQGTLTGLLSFTTVSKTIGIDSTMLGTLTPTGGTFAQYFPSGGSVSITLGVNFPLQDFPLTRHAFAQVELQNGTIVANTGCSQQSSNSSNFNGTPISAGDYIWFNANFTVNGTIAEGTTLNLTGATITFTANGTPYVLPAPNATVTFSASYSCASTTFNSLTQTWVTTVPLAGSDEIFLDGLAYPVPSGGLPGGINPIVWEGDFTSNMSGLSIQWQWGAAVYTQFDPTYQSLDVKPVHNNYSGCPYNNGDHAGTPEGDNSGGSPWKDFVIGGARGGGGSNWTGSWTGTVQVTMTCTAH